MGDDGVEAGRQVWKTREKSVRWERRGWKVGEKKVWEIKTKGENLCYKVGDGEQWGGDNGVEYVTVRLLMYVHGGLYDLIIVLLKRQWLFIGYFIISCRIIKSTLALVYLRVRSVV